MYGVLHKAADGFSEQGKLGEGGFGAVYRAWMNSADYAIKVMNVAAPEVQVRYIRECGCIPAHAFITLELLESKR